MSVSLRGHERIDRRSLAMHRAIAEKLRSDPALLAIARDNLERWSLAHGRSQPYWDAWREILDRPLGEVLDLMLEDSERMTAMRQATPFTGILTPHERWTIYPKNGGWDAAFRASSLSPNYLQQRQLSPIG